MIVSVVLPIPVSSLAAEGSDSRRNTAFVDSMEAPEKDGIWDEDVVVVDQVNPRIRISYEATGEDASFKNVVKADTEDSVTGDPVDPSDWDDTGRYIYDGEVTAVVEVEKENFSGDPVKLLVSRGGSEMTDSPKWCDEHISQWDRVTDDRGQVIPDHYRCRILLSEDGDYQISVVETGDYMEPMGYSFFASGDEPEEGMDSSYWITIDTTPPDADRMTLEYSQPVSYGDGDHWVEKMKNYFAYQDSITVTLTAEDDISGIDFMTWTYEREADASISHMEKRTETIRTKDIRYSGDHKTATAHFTLKTKDPKAWKEQYRGSISFTATDFAGNTSVRKTEENRVNIVDDISPTRTVIYSPAIQAVDGAALHTDSFHGNPVADGTEILYYDGDVDITFEIKEANFYPQDVDIRINGEKRKADGWKKKGDVWSGSMTLSGDGVYVVAMDYSDRSANPMESYQSAIIVIDTKDPRVEVDYSREHEVQTIEGISYFDGDITAAITLEEANFYEEDMVVSVSKDGAAYPVSVQWKELEADVHVGTWTMSEDGNYSVDLRYKDKSNHSMTDYRSSVMVIDTQLQAPVITINGGAADGRAFKDRAVLGVQFEDRNYDGYELSLIRTRYGDRDVDVTDAFLKKGITTTDQGGSGTFDTFSKEADTDGIYTILVSVRDKAGHLAESQAVFSVNRFGSVYEYSDYLVSLIQDGGTYVREVEEDLCITEYNADRLLRESLDIQISRDGKPLEQVLYQVTPEVDQQTQVGDSGWYQYQYILAKENFSEDGLYKIAVSSADEAGNLPETTNDSRKNILFWVDKKAPEINRIRGLEEAVIKAAKLDVSYIVYDAIGLKSVTVYVDEKEIQSVTDFGADSQHYEGELTLREKAVPQSIRFLVEDKAGNITDTDADDFRSSYVFHPSVLVSTDQWTQNPVNKRPVKILVACLVGISGSVFVYRIGKSLSSKTRR